MATISKNIPTLTFAPPEGGTIASTAAKLTFVSSSELLNQFNNASDVGTWTVKVNNPDAQSSGSVSFTVTNAHRHLQLQAYRRL